MAHYDGAIRINTKLNTQGFNTGIQSMTASLGKLAAAVGIAFSVGALVKMGKQAIGLASDIQEVDNVVSKSFGHMRGEMDALANTAIEKLGMSRLTAYQTGSTFMAMGKSMLDSAEDAKDMALALTEATGNLASFYNVTQDVASTALKSIYTGETETLKQFGIVMTETNLQQFAQEQGIRKTISAMSQSEKVTLRYKYVMEQLAFVGSDFADTQDSWANQTRILSEQWKELLSILGSGLITVLTPVVKGLNNIVASLINVANAAGKILSDLFGIQAQQLSVNAGSAEDAADAMTDYGNATEAAAKKAKDATAAFDDLNVLQSQQTSGNGGGFGGGVESKPIIPDGDSAMSQLELKMQSLLDKLSPFTAAIKKLWDDFAKGDFFQAGQDVSNLVVGIFDWFSDAISHVDWEALGTAIGDFMAGIDWGAILISVGKLIITAIQAGVDLWVSSFNAAPLETAIVTAISLLKYTGITSDLFSPLGSAVTASLTTVLSDAVAIAFQTAIIGSATWNIGSDILGAITGDTEKAEKIKEIGPIEGVKEILDDMDGLPNTFAGVEYAATALGIAYGEIANGMIYTDEQLARMQAKWQLSSEEMETLRQAMLNANPELQNLADNFTILWDASAETLQDISKGMSAVTDGTVSAASAFDEFRKPMWGMTDDALAFFKTMQDGSENLKNIVANNVRTSGMTIGSGFTDSLSQTDKEMVAWFQRVTDYSSSAGADTVNGYNDGIALNSDKTKQHIDAWENEIIKDVHDGPLKFGSPSKTMNNFGVNTVTGYNNGILKSAYTTKDVLNKWVSVAINPFFTIEKWKAFGETIRNGFTAGFIGVGDDVTLVCNTIIGNFEIMLNQIVKAINALTSGYNTIASSVGTSPLVGTVADIQLERIPKLATGAVIPPNQQFLAILGDQRSGTNIEAPLSTIEQAVQNVFDRNSVGGNQEIVIRFEGTPAQMVRELRPYIVKENHRIGLDFRK